MPYVAGFLAIFVFACYARHWPAGYLDGPLDCSWRNLSGLAMVALERWLSQPLSLSFDWATFYSPVGPELERMGFLSTSYPPGFLLPPFLLAKLVPSLPLPLVLRAIGLLWSFLLASLSAYACFQLTGRRPLALAAAATVLLFSPALFFLGNAWYADTYVLAPWMLSLALEARRIRTGKISRWEPLVFFLGLIGEWLFWIHLALLFWFRWRQGALGTWPRRIVSFLVPPALAVFVHLWPIHQRGLLSILRGRLQERTGLSLGYGKTLTAYVNNFWLRFVPDLAGSGGCFLFAPSWPVLFTFRPAGGFAARCALSACSRSAPRSCTPSF
jgi:hypothetical protein